jgi:hypothetical protein
MPHGDRVAAGAESREPEEAGRIRGRRHRRRILAAEDQLRRGHGPAARHVHHGPRVDGAGFEDDLEVLGPGGNVAAARAREAIGLDADHELALEQRVEREAAIGVAPGRGLELARPGTREHLDLRSGDGSSAGRQDLARDPAAGPEMQDDGLIARQLDVRAGLGAARGACQDVAGPRRGALEHVGPGLFLLGLEAALIDPEDRKDRRSRGPRAADEHAASRRGVPGGPDELDREGNGRLEDDVAEVAARGSRFRRLAELEAQPAEGARGLVDLDPHPAATRNVLEREAAVGPRLHPARRRLAREIPQRLPPEDDGGTLDGDCRPGLVLLTDDPAGDPPAAAQRGGIASSRLRRRLRDRDGRFLGLGLAGRRSRVARAWRRRLGRLRRRMVPRSAAHEDEYADSDQEDEAARGCNRDLRLGRHVGPLPAIVLEVSGPICLAQCSCLVLPAGLR